MCARGEGCGPEVPMHALPVAWGGREQENVGRQRALCACICKGKHIFAGRHPSRKPKQDEHRPFRRTLGSADGRGRRAALGADSPALGEPRRRGGCRLYGSLHAPGRPGRAAQRPQLLGRGARLCRRTPHAAAQRPHRHGAPRGGLAARSLRAAARGRPPVWPGQQRLRRRPRGALADLPCARSRGAPL